MLLAALSLVACGGGEATAPSSGGTGGAGPPGGGSTETGGSDTDDDGGEPRTVTVRMQNISYSRPSGGRDVTILLGEEIRWVNLDGTLHTATSLSVPEGGKGFDGQVEPGGEYFFRPNTTGTWVYGCTRFPDRMGTARIYVIE